MHQVLAGEKHHYIYYYTLSFFVRVLRLRRNTHYFDSLLSRAGILGKGALFVVLLLEDCLTGLTGSSTRAGTDCTDLQLIGSCVATARH